MTYEKETIRKHELSLGKQESVRKKIKVAPN